MKEALERIMQELRTSTEAPEMNSGEDGSREEGSSPQGKWDYYVETD